MGKETAAQQMSVEDLKLTAYRGIGKPAELAIAELRKRAEIEWNDYVMKMDSYFEGAK